jgi:hypothetical protein
VLAEVCELSIGNLSSVVAMAVVTTKRNQIQLHLSKAAFITIRPHKVGSYFLVLFASYGWQL